MKCQDVSATISFTGVMNIWQITLSTRNLKKPNKRPWTEMANEVLKNLPVKKRKVIIGPEDDLSEESRENDFPESFEDNPVLEKGLGVKTLKVDVLNAVDRTFTGVDENSVVTVNRTETKAWEQGLTELKMNIELRAEKRIEELLSRKLVKLQESQETVLKAKDKMLEELKSDLAECKLMFTEKFSKEDSSSDGNLMIDESEDNPAKVTLKKTQKIKPTEVKVKPAEVKVKPAEVKVKPTEVKAVSGSKKALKKKVLKTDSLLSDISRPGKSGEGDNEKPSRISRTVVKGLCKFRKKSSDRNLNVTVENSKKG